MSTEPTPPSPPPPSGPPPSGPSRGTTSVDFAAVPRNVWISLGGAVVLLISVFLDWYKVDIPSELGGGSVGIQGTDHNNLAWIVFLCAAVAIAAWVIEFYVTTVDLPAAAWQIAVGAGGLAVLIVLLRMVSKPASGLSLSYGIFVALLSAVAVVVGAYLYGQERQ
jgi:hypothetical protein